MKIFKYVIFLFVLVQALVFTAGATNHNVTYLPSVEEYDEIKALLPEIIPELNEILTEEGYDTKIGVEDIPLAEGYPIYINENYFAPEITTPGDLLSLVEKQDHYVWKVPVKAGNQIMLIGLGKGYPIRDEVRKFASEELIAELSAKEGKWNLTTVEFVSKEDLYTHKIQDAKINAEQVVFVNAITGNNLQMAICMDDKEFKSVLSLSDAEISYSVNENSRSSSHTISFNDGGIYSYEALQETLGMIYDSTSNDVSDDANTLMAQGGGGNYTMTTEKRTITLSVAVAAALLFVAFVIKKKYNRDFY